MEGLPLKVRTVPWNDKPMTDLVTQQIDRSERRELLAQARVPRVGGFRKDKPNPIVPGRFLVFPQHATEPVAHIDRKTGKHAPHLGIQRCKRLQHKHVRRLLFWFGGAAHPIFSASTLTWIR